MRRWFFYLKSYVLFCNLYNLCLFRLLVSLKRPNPGAPGSSNLHQMAGDQLPRLYKLLGDDLVVAGIPLQRQNPGAPSRRSWSPLLQLHFTALSVHRSRGRCPSTKRNKRYMLGNLKFCTHLGNRSCSFFHQSSKRIIYSVQLVLANHVRDTIEWKCCCVARSPIGSTTNSYIRSTTYITLVQLSASHQLT